MSFINTEFFKFVVVGGVNTVVYYAFYLVCLHGFTLHYLLAHVIGVVISIIGSFFLNSLYTYKVKPTWKKFFYFPLTQAVNITITAILLFILVDILHLNSSFAPIAALFVTIPITFVVTGRVMKSS
ncbi:GtrA family protein [Sporosarcina limicola]|uniref:Flippase GtrA n=1 Tax=Sporosarcina limicola TaxID=34101 RepID=A0A927RD06_9BACL|nr:GtrA family protein [Sporosarcina limicola]MBE1553232.1 putative flippase GtrA [Sporosarcina limicola]